MEGLGRLGHTTLDSSGEKKDFKVDSPVREYLGYEETKAKILFQILGNRVFSCKYNS